MSSFTIAGGTSASFTATEESFGDKQGLLEELTLKLIVPNPTQWGALFSLVTPHELVSVRACRGAAGAPPTIIVDIGGGAGVGTLEIDDLADWQALLTELSSEAPLGDVDSAARVARATFLLIPS